MHYMYANSLSMYPFSRLFFPCDYVIPILNRQDLFVEKAKMTHNMNGMHIRSNLTLPFQFDFFMCFSRFLISVQIVYVSCRHYWKTHITMRCFLMPSFYTKKDESKKISDTI